MSVRTARAASKAPALAGRVTGFGSKLKAFAAATDTTLDEAYRGIIIELFSSVIGDTPVDQGRARGNWQTTVGSPARSTTARLDQTGAVGSPGAKSMGGAVTEVFNTTIHLGDVVWMTNNLPYIHRLEYDHWSGQAPHGMVRKNMARINKIVNDVASGRRKL